MMTKAVRDSYGPQRFWVDCDHRGCIESLRAASDIIKMGWVVILDGATPREREWHFCPDHAKDRPWLDGNTALVDRPAQ